MSLPVVRLFPYDTTRELVCFIYGVLLVTIEQKHENTIFEFVKNYHYKKRWPEPPLVKVNEFSLLFKEFTGHACQSAYAAQ